jgi:TRAP-type mannitol/chloroaromatic compound transport system permease large subunit
MQADVLGITILVGSFFALLAIRVPVAFALGASSVLTAWYLDLPLMIVVQQMTRGLDSFSLMAIPFFILAGQIMGIGGISERMIAMSNVIVGRIRGGLAMVRWDLRILRGRHLVHRLYPDSHDEEKWVRR